MDVNKRSESVNGWELRCFADPQSLRDVAGILRDTRLLPAPIPGMDPELLAEGLEGDQPGAIVAYYAGAPFAYTTYAVSRKNMRLALGPFSYGHLPVRQLRIFGYRELGQTPPAALDRIVELLTSNNTWQVADLLEASPHDPLARRLMDKEAGTHRVIRKDVETIQVRLEKTFEAYLAKRFNKKVRYNLKREVRLLEDAAPGQVRMEIYDSEAAVDKYIEDAEKIARVTYQWKMGMNTLRSTPLMVRRTAYLARAGHWRGYILYIRDVPAAFCYSTVRRGELSYDTVGYDPKFAKLNPGKVLLFKILEELHESRFVEVLEFGRGLADYKMLFANSNRRVFDLSFFPYQPYSQFLWLLTVATETGYQQLRPLLRQWMPALKRRFRKAGLLFPSLLPDSELVTQLAHYI